MIAKSKCKILLMKYKISVIIPAYNYGHKIAAAVASVRAQNLSNVEMVIVNDSSTDNTDEVVSRLLGNDVIYIKNMENLGVNKTINIGFKAATGEYVCVLAADDELPENSLVSRYEHIVANDLDAVHGGTISIDSEQQRYFPPLNTSLPATIVDFLRDGSDTFGINNATFMYHIRIFERIGYRDETNTYFPHNDYEFALRTLSQCRVGLVNLPLYMYERHPNSHSDLHATNAAAVARLAKLKAQYIKLFESK